MNLFHPKRFAWLFSAAVMAAGCGAAHTASAAPEASGRDISGVWWIENYDPHLVPADGSAVPFTPEGKAEYDKNVSDLQSGKVDDPALKICLLQGLPRAMISAYPLKIVQHERTVTFIQEQNHAFWHSIIGIPHSKPDDVDLAFMGGESVSKWDGDTLIVDTLGFKLRTYLDEVGMPHDEDMHLVERLRKINGGKELEDLITIEDPKIFTHAWTARRTYVWSPEVKIMEYVCGEPHRALWGERAKAIHLHWKPL